MMGTVDFRRNSCDLFIFCQDNAVVLLNEGLHSDTYLLAQMWHLPVIYDVCYGCIFRLLCFAVRDIVFVLEGVLSLCRFPLT